MTLYLVEPGPETMPALVEGVMRAAARLRTDVRKPVTLIGVASLGEPDLLVEVDVVAVLD